MRGPSLLPVAVAAAAAATVCHSARASATAADPSTAALHLNPTNGDTVGLLWNAVEGRYSVMWDANSTCGWGHASTTDFLSYTLHGCAGPSRKGTMSGSVAFGAVSSAHHPRTHAPTPAAAA